MLAVALAALAFATAPLASASPGEYLNDLESDGIFPSNGNGEYLEEMGYGICSLLMSGYTPTAVARGLYRNSNYDNINPNVTGITWKQAQDAVVLAQADLCPTTSNLT